MKRTTAILSFIFCFALFTNAQDWSTDVYQYSEEYPGYIIEEDGTKKEGFITYKNRYTMQNEVIFYGEKGNKKTKEKYKTADLKEYKVADKVYHCISYSGGLLKKPIRANLLIKEGCINQYVWYNRADNYMVMQQGENETDEEFNKRKYPPVWVVNKAGTNEPKSIDQFGLKYKSKMAEFVAENPELAKKIEEGEKGYGMLAFEKIIDEYNAQCKE